MPRPDPEDRRAREPGKRNAAPRRSPAGGDGGTSRGRPGSSAGGRGRTEREYRPPRLGGGGATGGRAGGSSGGRAGGAAGGRRSGAASGGEREYRPPRLGAGASGRGGAGAPAARRAPGPSDRRGAPTGRRGVEADRGGRGGAGDREPRGGSGSRGRGTSGGDRGRASSGGDRRGGAPDRRPWPNAEEARSPRSWGSVARKGTRQLNEEGAGPASLAWRDAVAKSREGVDQEWTPDEVWVREADAPPAKARSKPVSSRGKPAPPPEERPGRKPRALPAEVAAELSEAASGAKVARLQQRLNDAAGAYERDRYGDAARMLKPLAEQAPGAAAVRELYGLTLYRLGRWDAAIKELEAFRALSDSIDQLPTLADCYRAKKRWKPVDELWAELRTASPSAALLAEGRLVQAGSLADRGRMGEAIELLEHAKTDQKKPKPDHLRTWYALADLYERAGEVPRARELFRRILRFDADLYDTAERLAAIGG